MSLKFARGFVVLFAIGTSSAALAQQQVAGIGFKLGDDIATVKSTLKVGYDPEPQERNAALPEGVVDVNKGKSFYHLRTKGIWVFFTKMGKVETIRIDAPYASTVAGISLGDSLAKLKSTLGEPLRKPFSAFGNMQGYNYAFDDTAFVTFDLNDDGVQYIFFHK